MEEKKKRWRPSLTAFREQEETIHRQCVELDAWRDKYRALHREHGRLKVSHVALVKDQGKLRSDYEALYKKASACAHDSADLSKRADILSKECNRLREVRDDYVPSDKHKEVKERLATAEQSNALLEKELAQVRESHAVLSKTVLEQDRRIEEIMSRGLLSRILNRKK